jgi:hypothetical protein
VVFGIERVDRTAKRRLVAFSSGIVMMNIYYHPLM